MSRKICHKCCRTAKVCICKFITEVANTIEIGIIQHPSEVKQVKGTAVIAKLSLVKSRLWVAENIDNNPEITQWLSDSKPVYLLYPNTYDQDPAVSNLEIKSLQYIPPKNYKILVLDGTWRKTFKMLQINPELQKLDRLSLVPEQASNYIVRKQKDRNSLSTIEAIYELLSQLEGNRGKFAPLLNAFELMQQQQMSFRKTEQL